ncbi:MAG TPA: TlpA disulfide reductase family protein [Tenuifilaceae bacterium]|nr:TlpA disulfide reductase family protein [Tenuifilaceae bacterium]
MIQLRFAVLLSIVLLFSQNLTAQVTVTGNAPTYAGDDITFYRYSDLITQTEEKIGNCKVGNTGDFKCKLNIDETSFVFSYLGIYRVYLFAEPGKVYEVVLPEKEEKTEPQRLNPFFRQVEVHVGIKGIQKNDLNYLINAFDLAFNEHFNTIVNDAYAGKESISIDSLTQNLEQRFSPYNHTFFNSYRKYRYGLLNQLSLMQKSRSISDNYFLNKPILYNNPSYMELFNLVYDKYFLFFARSETGNAVFNNISEQKSYTRLKKTLASDAVLSNDSLMELVILKGLHDGFFDDKFSRSALLAVLDSLYKQTKIAEHLIIAENIRSKVTKLLPGFVPSPFKLYTSEGKLVSLDDFTGKYVYLNFCTTSSYTCLQEFSLLEKLYEKHKKLLEIVTICVDREENEMKNFLEQTNYDWTFLYYGNKPDIIKDFDIRAYPTYFLIGPDKKMVMSPAPSPKENFEIQLFNLLRSKGEI